MKSMSFDEFFAMPLGTIFGQDEVSPDQEDFGLYIKGESFPSVDVLDDDSDDPYQEAGVEIRYALMGPTGFEDDEWFITATCPGDGRKFLIYEPDDLDRLAGLIGRGPGWAAQQGDGEGNGLTWEVYNR